MKPYSEEEQERLGLLKIHRPTSVTVTIRSTGEALQINGSDIKLVERHKTVDQELEDILVGCRPKV